MLPFVLFFTNYFGTLPISSSLLACNPSSLQGHPAAVFFIPSLVGDKRKIEFSLTSCTFLQTFKIYSLSFSYKKVALGMHYLGTKDINQKNYALGFSRKLKDVDLGFSITVDEKNFENFISQQIYCCLACSKNSEDLAFGASLSKSLSKREKTLNVFVVYSEPFGRTYFDYIFQLQERTLSLCQEFNIFPLLNLTFGFSKNPEQYFAGLTFNNYIRPSLSIRYLQNLGFFITSGIEYTF